MQKLKKALKKLTDLAHKTTPGGTPAQAAKKASPVKRKAQAVAGAAKPAKSAVSKKAAPIKKAVVAQKVKPKPAAVVAKPEAKELKKKVLKPVVAKGPEKAPAVKVVKKAPVAAAPEVKAPVLKPAKDLKKELKKKEEKPRASAAAQAASTEEEIVLTDAEGRRYCRLKDCDQVAAVDAYCRYHYLLFWKNIQNRNKILSEGKLERYIEELTARYPDKYLELLRKDLRSEKDFTAAIQELEIDDSGVENEFEDEAQSYLEEVRGMSSEAGAEREEDF